MSGLMITAILLMSSKNIQNACPVNLLNYPKYKRWNKDHLLLAISSDGKMLFPLCHFTKLAMVALDHIGCVNELADLWRILKEVTLQTSRSGLSCGCYLQFARRFVLGRGEFAIIGLRRES
jgi:hypothetical protein